MLRLGLAENEFPSPRGDKENHRHGQDKPRARKFPSPRGDKENQVADDKIAIHTPFPSPRGDKENPSVVGTVPLTVNCFRPLTGIKKIMSKGTEQTARQAFPSPRGDKENR